MHVLKYHMHPIKNVQLSCINTHRIHKKETENIVKYFKCQWQLNDN